jgi:hypothetical protein
MSEETPQPCCQPEPLPPCDEHPRAPRPPADRRPSPPRDLLRRLPPGARWRGAIRLPLSLRQAPGLHLVETPPGTLRWFVRLPDRRGELVWRTLPLPVPAAWARASGFPALALAMERLLREAAPRALVRHPGPEQETPA